MFGFIKERFLSLPNRFIDQLVLASDDCASLISDAMQKLGIVGVALAMFQNKTGGSIGQGLCFWQPCHDSLEGQKSRSLWADA